MKVRAVLHFSSFQIIATILSISWVSGQAPYPPSGSRPSGRQFGLPKRPPPNQFGAPTRPPPNQYGAPVNRPQVTVTPPDQYLPGLDPTFVRTNLGGQQQNFLNQGQTVNNQQPQVQQANNDQQNYLAQEQVNQQQEQNYFDIQAWISDSQQKTYSNQDTAASNQNAKTGQTQISTQNVGVSSINRNYLTPQQNPNQQNQNFGPSVPNQQAQGYQNQQLANNEQQNYNRQQQGWTLDSQQQTFSNPNLQGWTQDNVNHNFRTTQAGTSTQNSGVSSINRGYLTPQQNQNFGQPALNQQNNLVRNQQQSANEQQSNQQTSVGQTGQQSFQQQTFTQQGWTQDNAPSNDNAKRVQTQNSGVSSINRSYLTPQQNQNLGQQKSAQQLYQTDEQNDEDSFASEGNQGTRDDSVPSTKGLNANGKNYLPPTTTESYLRKPTRGRYPEPTTIRPEPQEPEEPEEDQPEDPNVAIATAVARGQYYFLQPDGRLQRVTYKTTQTHEDLKNNGFSAKLIYQNVDPLTAPLLTYSVPWVKLN